MRVKHNHYRKMEDESPDKFSKSKLNKSDNSSDLTELKLVSKVFGIFVVSSVSLVLLIGTFLISSGFTVHADNSAADNITVTVPTSCTMGGDVISAHTVSLISGQSAEDIGTTKIKAYCNDSNGYAIYAVGSGNGEDGNTDLVSSLGDTYNIHTGLAMSGDTSAWAMKLTAGTGTGSYTDPTTGQTVATSITPPNIASDTEGSFSAYHTVPNDFKVVAYRNSSTDMNTRVDSTGSYIETTYRIYTSGVQPADTYVGRVKYALVRPSTAPSPVSFERAFKAANKTKATALDGNNYYKMQDMSASICSSVNIIGEGSQTKLVDVRDSKTYYVAKLEDGNCWMTQNLDLDLTSGVALDSTTTNLTTYGTAPYVTGYSESNGVISWTPQDWTSTETTGSKSVSATTRTPNASGNFDNWVNGTDASGADQYKDGYIHPLSANPGDWYQKGTYFNSTTCSFLTNPGGCTNYFTTTPDTVNGDHGHVGNYYNYTASIASNDTSGVSSNYQQNSICPANWRLPKNGEYGTLNTLYNDGRIGQTDPITQGRDSGLFNAPLYLVRAGNVNGGTLGSPANNASYWSGTLGSSADAYYLSFRSTYVYPSNYYTRWYGFSVRCLADNIIDDISDLN